MVRLNKRMLERLELLDCNMEANNEKLVIEIPLDNDMAFTVHYDLMKLAHSK